MSYITYRASVIPSAKNTNDVQKNNPLSNDEIDKNFYTLNQDKLDTDGSVETQYIAFKDYSTVIPTNNKNVIFVNSENEIQLGLAGSTIKFGGGNITGLEDTVQQINQASTSKITTLGYDSANQASSVITSISEAGGGGIQLGQETVGKGYVNLKYSNSQGETGWKASAYDSTPINFVASDFKITGDLNKTLLNAYTQLNDINQTLGTNSTSVLTNNFSQGNVISPGDSLKAAITALDNTNIPGIIEYVAGGTTIPDTVVVNNSNGVLASPSSLLAAINTLNEATRYIVYKTINVSTSSTATPGALHVIFPPQNSNVTITLPSTANGRGLFAFTLKDDSDARHALIKTTGSDQIFLNSDTTITQSDSIKLDISNYTIYIMWDSANTIWRVI